MKTIYIVAYSNPYDDGGYQVFDTEADAIDLAEEWADADWRSRQTQIRVLEIDLSTVNTIREFTWTNRMLDRFTYLEPKSVLDVELTEGGMLVSVRLTEIVSDQGVVLRLSNGRTRMVAFDEIEGAWIVGAS